MSLAAKPRGGQFERQIRVDFLGCTDQVDEPRVSNDVDDPDPERSPNLPRARYLINESPRCLKDLLGPSQRFDALRGQRQPPMFTVGQLVMTQRNLHSLSR